MIGFPCNQFGVQENSTEQEILPTLAHVRPGGGFQPNFPLTTKIMVNGKEEHPIYGFLKKAAPRKQAALGRNYIVNPGEPPKLEKTPCEQNDVQWNFAKYVISKDGTQVSQLDPFDDLEDMRAAVEKALAE